MLLATKLYAPQHHTHLVARPRLLAKVQTGFTGKLILLSAPAGFGKTTLVTEWLAIQPPPQKWGWLSLDEHDNDPIRFLAYLIAALQTVDASIGLTARNMMQTPQPPAVDLLLTMVINDLSAMPQPITLVLDDYHAITSPAIHEIVTFLVERMPAIMTLLMTTRTDPPLPLSRWRVQRVLTEIRQRDLRFSEAETAQFLTTTLDFVLSDEEVKALESRTEGWAAGLQLAALSLQQQDKSRDFVRHFTGSNLFVIDYLAEEVLQQLPPATHNFLLHTAIADRFCAPLCNVLTEREDGQTMLEALLRANLFLIPLDDQRRWFRYHHLFGEVLRRSLLQQNKAQVNDLHRRAAQWFAEQSLTMEAIHHALAAGEFVYAGELIESSAMTWRNQGAIVTLAKLLDQIPSAVLITRPQLCLEKGHVHMFHHQLDEADHWLAAAERALQAAERSDPLLVGRIGAVKTDVALNRGEVWRAIQLGEAALTHLPDDEQFTRSYVFFLLAIAYSWRGHNSQLGPTNAAVAPAASYMQARQAFEAAVQLGKQAGTMLITVYSLAALAQLYLRLGQWQNAYSTLQQALEYAQKQGVEQTLIVASTYMHLGEVYYEWNNFAAADHHFSTGLHLAEMARNPRTQLSIHRCRLLLYAAQQERAQIVQSIEQANRLIAQYPLAPAMVNDFRIAQIQHELPDALSPAAATWLATVTAPAHGPVETDMANVDLLWARLHLIKDEYEPAQSLLQRACHHAQTIGEIPIAVEALRWLSITYLRMGKRDEAHQTVTQMLTLAEPLGFLRTIVDGGADLRALLLTCQRERVFAGQPPLQAYIDRLLSAFPAATADVTPPVALPQSPAAQTFTSVIAHSPMVEPLSEREVEVLRLVAAGLSNNQIAERLIVTVGTVKRHLNNIFGKLGVGSRTQALVRAREAKLLD